MHTNKSNFIYGLSTLVVLFIFLTNFSWFSPFPFSCVRHNQSSMLILRLIKFRSDLLVRHSHGFFFTLAGVFDVSFFPSSSSSTSSYSESLSSKTSSSSSSSVAFSASLNCGSLEGSFDSGSATFVCVSVGDSKKNFSLE